MSHPVLPPREPQQPQGPQQPQQRQGPQQQGPQQQGPRQPQRPQKPQRPQGPVEIPKALRGWMLLLVVLMTGVILYSSAPLPWLFLPLALSFASVGVAVYLLVLMGRARVRGVIRAWAVTMLVFASLSSLFTVGAIALQPIVGPFQSCIRDSVTLSGVHGCQTEYERSIERMTGVPVQQR